MSDLHDKNILLGISGGIAAYKSAELTRLLIKQGARVRVCMTESAMQFIQPLTFQALSGNPVHTDLFDLQAEAAMGHIELARWADMILIAPTTANVIARLAHGLADDLLSTLCLATDAPVALAPAMNRLMWANVATQDNISTLQQRNVILLGPDEGSQACGETGPGRMLEPADIVSAVLQIFATEKPLANASILITAGPTREAIDPVRYISNRSSGKMGYAIARAARDMGASVTLVTGPTSLNCPKSINTIPVQSAREMYKAVMQQAGQADIFVATAAVADYTPSQTAGQKLKKNDRDQGMLLELQQTRDILADVSHQHPHLFTVGFAAETNNLIDYAKAKLIRKNLDMIAANPVGQNQGFDVDDNQLEILWEGGHVSLPKTSKQQLAKQLMLIVSKHYQNSRKTTRKTR
jgi:phosphopantothenoylcysteine decarboxylase/phosphopantothenate--cysteine ligase